VILTGLVSQTGSRFSGGTFQSGTVFPDPSRFDVLVPRDSSGAIIVGGIIVDNRGFLVASTVEASAKYANDPLNGDNQVLVNVFCPIGTTPLSGGVAYISGGSFRSGLSPLNVNDSHPFLFAGRWGWTVTMTNTSAFLSGHDVTADVTLTCAVVN
jgi:hypothetical protein